MAELAKCEIVDFGATRVIGRPVVAGMDMQQNPIPAFWEQCFADGTFPALEALDGAVSPDYVGLMCRWGGGDNNFTCIVGMLMKPGTPVPEGFDHEDLPVGQVAIGWVRGTEQEIYQASHPLTQADMERQGYVMDEAAGWCMELYNCPRFTEKDAEGLQILDYYIPCVKKG